MVMTLKLTPRAVSILRSGRTVAAELPASEYRLRRWVMVSPYIKGFVGGAPYRGDGVPAFDIYLFEAPRESIEAGYDVVGELVNGLRVTVEPNQSLESTLEDLEAKLLSLNIDPAILDKPDDDFPL
jgi:hypothetical protein